VGEVASVYCDRSLVLRREAWCCARHWQSPVAAAMACAAATSTRSIRAVPSHCAMLMLVVDLLQLFTTVCSLHDADTRVASRLGAFAQRGSARSFPRVLTPV
jgi:hypothetical protein